MFFPLFNNGERDSNQDLRVVLLDRVNSIHSFDLWRPSIKQTVQEKKFFKHCKMVVGDLMAEGSNPAAAASNSYGIAANMLVYLENKE